jgi:hypothetical protein
MKQWRTRNTSIGVWGSRRLFGNPTTRWDGSVAAKGQGEFTLLHSMPGPGYFHLLLQAEDGDKSGTFANVYFGTGDNVLRK